METAYREKSCETCGATFQPASGRQKYCPSCGPYGKANCANCGQSFHPTSNSNGRYCSRACWGEHSGKPESASRDCAACGKRFKPGKPGQRFCSRPCAASLRRNPPRTCTVCGTEFKPIRDTQETCSQACWQSLVRRPSRTCPVCGKQFDNRHREQETCSKACRGIQLRGPRNETCEGCGKPLPFNRYRQQRFCSRECRGLPIGTRKLTSGGYVYLKVGKGHPTADVRGYVLEHRYVIEQQIGRPLTKQEHVHHKNGDRADNRPENLELWAGKDPKGQRSADTLIHALEQLSAEDRRRVLEHFRE